MWKQSRQLTYKLKKYFQRKNFGYDKHHQISKSNNSIADRDYQEHYREYLETSNETAP